MKRIISGMAFLMTVLTVSAGPVSKDQAKNIAKSFLQARGIEMEAPQVAFKAPKVGNSVSEEAYYYIFNAGQEKGFVIVSGDDTTRPILGYAEKGSFDEETMPANMRSWLQHYADEMKYLETHRVAVPENNSQATNAPKKSSPSRHSVPTLMTSTWNQGSPYNDKCPTYYTSDGGSGTSATGCVATALAQVLYFYKYPEKTKTRIPGMSNSYDTPDGTKTVSLSGIKAGTVIDWDNMVDNYTGNETQEQKDAVATLMLMCGQAVKMGYGASSGAAFGDNIPEMYNKYFNYDDKAYAASRDKYSSADWFNLIYNEVATGHPIPMAGYSSGGGHSFVIDGFDGDELFHLNWGWGGMCDGYFLISVMNPDDNSGTGASSSSDGYSMGECIVIGLDMPDEETTESATHMTINDTRVEGTSVFSNYINWTGNTHSFNGAIVMKNEEGELVAASDVYNADNLGANYYYGWSFDMNGKLKTPGTYKLSPASKLAENKIWRPEFNMTTEYIEVVVDENGETKSVAYHTPVEDIEAIDWNFTGTLTANKEQEVKITFKNNGDEFYREVHVFASSTAAKLGTDCRFALAAKEGETVTYSGFFTPDKTGTWNIWICKGSDGSGELAKTTVTIGSTAQNSANLSVNSFTISNNSYGNCLVGSISVKNKATTDFDGNIKLQLWRYNPDDGLCWGCGSQVVGISANSGANGTGDFNFQNLEIGTTYFITVAYTTQDDEFDNGGLVWSHSWELKAGYLTWGTTGSISGSAASNTVQISSSASGALFDGVDIATIKAGTNPNTIYAFKSGSQVPSSLDGYNVVSEGIAENITLTDTKAVYSPVDFVASKATFSHTFSHASDGVKGWEAITLPFRPDRATVDGEEVTWKTGNAEGKFWLREFSELSDDNEVIFSDVDDFTSLRGNTPYIIAAPEEMVGKTIVFEGENASFKNTGKDNMLVGSDAFRFYGMTLNKRIGNVFVMNEAGDAYEYISSNETVKAFKNYFEWKLDDASRPARIKISNDATGIKEVSPTGVGDGKIFDLQGREVKNPGNGVYIVNGKKTIINR